jgi:hypothetical protein
MDINIDVGAGINPSVSNETYVTNEKLLTMMVK